MGKMQDNEGELAIYSLWLWAKLHAEFSQAPFARTTHVYVTPSQCRVEKKERKKSFVGKTEDSGTLSTFLTRRYSMEPMEHGGVRGATLGTLCTHLFWRYFPSKGIQATKRRTIHHAAIHSQRGTYGNEGPLDPESALRKRQSNK